MHTETPLSRCGCVLSTMRIVNCFCGSPYARIMTGGPSPWIQPISVYITPIQGLNICVALTWHVFFFLLPTPRKKTTPNTLFECLKPVVDIFSPFRQTVLHIPIFFGSFDRFFVGVTTGMRK